MDDEKEMDTAVVPWISGVRRSRRPGRARTLELAAAAAARSPHRHVLAGAGHSGAVSHSVRRVRSSRRTWRRQAWRTHDTRGARTAPARDAVPGRRDVGSNGDLTQRWAGRAGTRDASAQ